MHHVEQVIGIGATTFSAAQPLAQYDLTPVPSMVQFGRKGAPYVNRLVLQIQLLVNNTTGGTINLTSPKIYDCLQQAILVTPEFQFLNLLNQAGQSLWVDSYFRKLKLPEVFPSSFAITNSSTGTLNLVLVIDFTDARLQSPEDPLLLAELCNDSKLLLQWTTNAATFGTNTAITAASSFTVWVDLVPRDEIRLPTLVHLEEFAPVKLIASIPINGVFFTDIALEAVNAQGQASYNFNSASDITNIVQFNIDGVDYLKNVPASVPIELWNENTWAGGDRLPQYQANTNYLIPLTNVRKTSGRSSHLPINRGNPSYNFAGSISPSTLMFFMRWLSPQGSSYAQKALSRIGIWDKLGSNPFSKLQVKVNKKGISASELTKAMVMPIIVPGNHQELLKAA